MGKDDKKIRHKFSASYIKLCMTEEIKSRFGPPLFKDNHCIYKGDPKDIFHVVYYGGTTTDIDVEGDIERVKTSELIWIPTAKEIQQEFHIQENDGFWCDYKNFITDPTDFGYSREELSHFRSEEERWLLYNMKVMCGKKIVENKWIKCKHQ